MVQLKLSTVQQKILQEQSVHSEKQAEETQELDALARSDREYELQSLLEERGMDNAWEVTPALRIPASLGTGPCYAEFRIAGGSRGLADGRRHRIFEDLHFRSGDKVGRRQHEGSCREVSWNYSL